MRLLLVPGGWLGVRCLCLWLVSGFVFCEFFGCGFDAFSFLGFGLMTMWVAYWLSGAN